MNMLELAQIQKELDDRIVKEKGLQNQDLLSERILALYVELGECANEWRGFKFWSNDQEPRKEIKCHECNGRGFNFKSSTAIPGVARVSSEKIPCNNCENGYINPLLEEYVDCLHFVLSIGLELDVINDSGGVKVFNFDNPVQSFNKVFDIISSLYRNMTSKQTASLLWKKLKYQFLKLGEDLGFTEQQIYDAYLDKNNVNHERQASGY